MARDSLPHFPAPEKSHRHSQPSSQEYMYPSYQQSGGIPGGYPPPAGGYQLAPTNVYGSPPQSVQQPYGYPGQRPSSSQSPPGIDPQIYSRFKAADVSNTGQLTERELKTALLNNDWTQFDGKTIKLMIKMFDVDRYLSPFRK
jgi:peflin